MKLRPIVGRQHEVRAILAGQRTQLRRVVKGLEADEVVVKVEAEGFFKGFDLDHGVLPRVRRLLFPQLIKCPYGVVGDQIWMRESWGMAFTHEVPENHPKTLAGTWGVPAYPHFIPCVVYKADGNFPIAEYWRGSFFPPLFMPREYSRIRLEITNIRIEQLRSITEQDAIAEGVGSVADYADLWESINSKKHPWSDNPWVWVVEFKCIGGAA